MRAAVGTVAHYRALLRVQPVDRGVTLDEGENSQPIEVWLEGQLGLDARLGDEARVELTMRLIASDDREPTRGAVTTLTAGSCGCSWRPVCSRPP